MKKGRTFLCGILIVAVIGCSAFRPDRQALKLNCKDPAIKKVLVNGDPHECPGEVEVRRNSKVTVEAFGEGNERYSKTIDYHLSGTGKLDIAGTFLLFFPVFGLMFPGAWDLNETEVNVVLYSP